MPRSIAQVKQPKYKLIKTGFLPLVSPSHSISPNLVGVFYIGITPHEPLWCFLPGWCWWVSLDILKRAWMWWVYMMILSWNLFMKIEKTTFSLHSNSTFGCLGIKLGKCREPWSPDPRLIQAQVKGYLVLPLPQNAHVTNALIHPERRWRSSSLQVPSFRDILFKTLQGVRIWPYIFLVFPIFSQATLQMDTFERYFEGGRFYVVGGWQYQIFDDFLKGSHFMMRTWHFDGRSWPWRWWFRRYLDTTGATKVKIPGRACCLVLTVVEIWFKKSYLDGRKPRMHPEIMTCRFLHFHDS